MALKAGAVVTVSSPFDRLYPPNGTAVVRWVYPGGDVWITPVGVFDFDAFDVNNGPNFGASLITDTGSIDAATVNWAGPFEVADNVADIKANGSEATVTLGNSTVAQNAAAIRAAYQTATRLEAVMIGDFLSTLTDVQLQNAFNLTPVQVTNLRTNKLTPAANTAAAIRSALGQ